MTTKELAQNDWHCQTPGGMGWKLWDDAERVYETHAPPSLILVLSQDPLTSFRVSFYSRDADLFESDYSNIDL